MKNVHEIEFIIKDKEWEKLLEESFKKNVKNTKIDGFRKGHVTKELYIKKFGIESLYRDAMDLGLDNAFQSVMKDNKDLIPVVEPSVDIKEVDEKHIKYVFTIITKPEVKLGKYKSLGIKKEKVSVSKEELSEEIDRLRSRFAEIIIKENGEVADKNTAIINFEGFVDGKKLDGGSGENYPLEIGSNTFIPGFEEGLIGMKSGETKELKLKFPENYTPELKGKDVVFNVTVNEIKERVLPELNKDFYEDLGYKDVKTKEDFEKKVKEDITKRKEASIEDKYIDDCIKAAVENMKIELNHELIHEEIHRMLHQTEEQMKMQGLTLEQYLQATGMSMDKLEEQMHPEAENRVKARYMLEAVADAEKIEISDKDADAEAKKMAENYGMTKEDLLAEFGGIEVLKFDMRMRKAIEIVKGE
ncbi:MAG: trigger factor [Bacilli bacterium]|nr:trigger factor [Bacilli bacterium]